MLHFTVQTSSTHYLALKVRDSHRLILVCKNTTIIYCLSYSCLLFSVASSLVSGKKSQTFFEIIENYVVARIFRVNGFGIVVLPINGLAHELLQICFLPIGFIPWQKPLQPSSPKIRRWQLRQIVHVLESTSGPASVSLNGLCSGNEREASKYIRCMTLRHESPPSSTSLQPMSTAWRRWCYTIRGKFLLHLRSWLQRLQTWQVGKAFPSRFWNPLRCNRAHGRAAHERVKYRL